MTVKTDSEHNRTLQWVARAALTGDVTRTFLSGVLFHGTTDGRVAAVATDGKRLHKATFPRTYVEALGFEIASYSNRSTWMAQRIVKLTKTKIDFGERMTATFPDYERVIPQSPPYATTLAIEEPRLLLPYLMKVMERDGHRVAMFDPDYTEDVWPVCDRVAFNAPDKPFTFRTAVGDPFDRMAVIAPMAGPAWLRH